MAISKAAAAEARLRSQAAVVKALEDRIDAMLIAGNSFIDISHWSRSEQDAIDAVLALYRKQGWTAEVVYDQREGNYIRLS